MRPPVLRALVALLSAPLHPEPEPPPPTPEEFARNLVSVALRQSPGHRRAMADGFGAVMAANLAAAYRPEVP